MKFSNILKTTVMTLGAAVLMCVSVTAATSVKSGTATKESEYKQISVPVIVQSNDYSNIAGVAFTLKFDKTKYSFNLAEADDNLDWGDDFVSGKKRTLKGTKTINTNENGIYLSWVAGDAGSVPLSNTESVLVNILLDPVDYNAEIDYSNDYSVVDVTSILTIDSTDHQQTVNQSERATYVICDAIPEDVTGSEWEGKFIHKLRVDVKTAGTDTIIKSDYIKQYYVDDNGKCVFVLKLVPNSGKKQIVDVDFVAEYATSSSATEASESATVQSFKDVVVEALS
jgi:hypothetical protein